MQVEAWAEVLVDLQIVAAVEGAAKELVGHAVAFSVTDEAAGGGVAASGLAMGSAAYSLEVALAAAGDTQAAWKTFCHLAS